MGDQQFQPTRSQQRFLKRRSLVFMMLGLTVILASALVVLFHYSTYAAQGLGTGAGGDWPMYMHDVGRGGFNKSESIITRASAPNLKIHWKIQSGGTIFSQPVVANGMVYWGSFDGYEHAANLNGNEIWQKNLGSITQCAPVQPLGVVSTAAVVNGVVYVGGGDDHLYALDATTGAIRWSTLLGVPNTNTFIWDSPFVFNNTVYIGTATTGESSGCKLVAGQFFALNASNGSIAHTYNTVPNGCVGGGIWSSPTFDASDGSIYFTAGTQGTCGSDHISIGIVKLRGSDLKLLASWQIPPDQRLTHDADFAGTPTLFTATINGVVQKRVGAVDKNGYYYAFNRASLSSGPVWSTKIATPGACPQCGQGSISSSGWDGQNLYVAGGSTTIGSQNCGGSLRALNPVDGSPNNTFIWQACLPGTILGAVTQVTGVIAVVDKSSLTLFNSATGAQLFNDANKYYGSPSISNGVLYVGGKTGQLTAFGL